MELKPIDQFKNSKEWRIAHGFTTPEWEMYSKYVVTINKLQAICGILVGFALGVGASILHFGWW